VRLQRRLQQEPSCIQRGRLHALAHANQQQWRKGLGSDSSAVAALFSE